MKTLNVVLVIVLSLTFLFNLKAQYPDTITFFSQAQIDAFPNNYPDDNGMPLFVTIQGSNIVNLDSLISLDSIGHTLLITENDSLNSLKGLDSLTYVQNIIIENNTTLNSLNGLNALYSVEVHLVIKNNDELSDLSGLNNLYSVGDTATLGNYGGIKIEDNDGLASLHGLDNLVYVIGYKRSNLSCGVGIINNASLENLNGLESLVLVEGAMNIDNNASLITLTGLESLNKVGNCLHKFGFITSKGIQISNNESLSSLDGLVNLSDENSLTISGNNSLTNLSTLSYLTKIEDLTIDNNDNLNNLAAIENLDSITYFEITGNANLTSLSDLEGLSYLGQLRLDSTYLTNLNGLEGLSNIGGMAFVENPLLSSLQAFNQIDSIGEGGLFLEGNLLIDSLFDFNNLVSIKGSLSLKNTYISSLKGIENVEHLGGLSVEGNSLLTSLSELESLSTILGGIRISYSVLSNLNGLENINTVTGLTLSDNQLLESLNGLENLDSAFVQVSIIRNNLIQSLNGLDSLTYIGGYGGPMASGLSIWDNESLVDLTALQNLNSVSRLEIIQNNVLSSLCGLENIDAATIISWIWIKDNPNLSECHVASICDFLDDGGFVLSISGNANGCNGISQINASCIESLACEVTPVEEILFKNNDIQIFPNPATNYLNIQLPEKTTQPIEINLFDLQGRLISRQMISNGESFDLSHLTSGMYSIKTRIDGKVFLTKFVKL